MTIRFNARFAPAFALLSLVFAACGGGMEARPEPQRAAPAVAFRPAAPGGDACGTFERPCVLQEIRVSGAAAE